MVHCPPRSTPLYYITGNALRLPALTTFPGDYFVEKQVRNDKIAIRLCGCPVSRAYLFPLRISPHRRSRAHTADDGHLHRNPNSLTPETTPFKTLKHLFRCVSIIVDLFAVIAQILRVLISSGRNGRAAESHQRSAVSSSATNKPKRW